MRKLVLVLLSGGIDSTVLAKHYLDKGWDVSSMFVNHNQPLDDLEYTKFREISSLLEIPIKVYSYSDFQYDGFFGPCRNAFLLTLAVNEAYHLKIGNVAIGVCHGEYLDTRPEFIDRFNFMLEMCLKDPIYVLAPFAHWSVERVIKYGIKIGAPLHLTVSCMSLKDGKPCGECHKCRIRQKWGIDDYTVSPNFRKLEVKVA